MVRNGKEAPRYQLSEAEQRFERWRRRLGLGLGPLAFAATFVLTPPTLTASERTTLAVVLWVLLWWVTEAVPLPVAALFGPTLLVMLHADTPTALFSPFADPVIFLFLGSFILAEGTVASGLDRRLALSVLSWRWVTRTPFRIVAAMGFLGAAVSMWLSNTATAAMLYPLALAVARSLENASSKSRSPFATALLLTIAYTASIGGIGTPVGTPPNLIAIGQLEKLAGLRVTFFQWMGVGVPVVLLMLALCVIYLGRHAGKRTATGSPEALRTELPPFSVRERNVVLAFFLAVTLWLLPGSLTFVLGEGHPWAREASRTLPEGAVAILAATLLFVLPVRWDKLEFTLSWREAKAIDWGTLVLFGGGLSLGNQLFKTGLAAKAGESLVTLTGARDVLSLSYLFAFAALVLTETTSNTAAATVVCPLAIAAAQAAGVNPVPPTMAAAVTASLAFMLPVSTPPNAIVYGSGFIRVTDMLRHGVFLDFLGLAVIPPLVVFLCRVLSIATVG
ncbi:Sodium-dependent dicarboxylate transporter SdcS [bacterium HR09]|nr:Sodium-dependent dicarboxylate transporter SdcS [bacterium HR09]